jgi:predicted dehydrogenase
LDTVQVSLDYGEAGSAQVQLTWGLPRGVPAVERHSYIGPGGMIETDGQVATLLQGPEPELYRRPEVDAWREQIHAFARELDGVGPQGLADAQAGIRALRASLAVLQAVEERREVAA